VASGGVGTGRFPWAIPRVLSDGVGQRRSVSCAEFQDSFKRPSACLTSPATTCSPCRTRPPQPRGATHLRAPRGEDVEWREKGLEGLGGGLRPRLHSSRLAGASTPIGRWRARNGPGRAAGRPGERPLVRAGMIGRTCDAPRQRASSLGSTAAPRQPRRLPGGRTDPSPEKGGARSRSPVRRPTATSRTRKTGGAPPARRCASCFSGSTPTRSRPSPSPTSARPSPPWRRTVGVFVRQSSGWINAAVRKLPGSPAALAASGSTGSPATPPTSRPWPSESRGCCATNASCSGAPRCSPTSTPISRGG